MYTFDSVLRPHSASTPTHLQVAWYATTSTRRPTWTTTTAPTRAARAPSASTTTPSRPSTTGCASHPCRDAHAACQPTSTGRRGDGPRSRLAWTREHTRTTSARRCTSRTSASTLRLAAPTRTRSTSSHGPRPRGPTRCVYPVYGCTSPRALNYNPKANRLTAGACWWPYTARTDK